MPIVNEFSKRMKSKTQNKSRSEILFYSLIQK